VTVTAVPLVSASALKRCGWARVLDEQKTRSSKAVAAADKGTKFGAVMETFVNTGQLPDAKDDTINSWVDNLLHRWRPRPGAVAEVPLGLGPGPTYVEVKEAKPHVYVPVKPGTPLLTAGRPDVVHPGTQLEVIDWKSGIYEPEDPNTNLQLWALGISAGLRWHAHEVRVGLYMVQDCRFVWSDPVVVGSQEWQLRVTDVEEAATVGDKPVPGANCLSCWQRRNCEYATEAA
jgi:hypothetical protein